MADKDFNEEVKMSQGEILKRARESQSISLNTIHEQTNIPLDALKAIEEGYMVRTLSPFYRKSFIKMYAKCLKVEIDDVIEERRKASPPLNTSHKKGRSLEFNEPLERRAEQKIEKRFNIKEPKTPDLAKKIERKVEVKDPLSLRPAQKIEQMIDGFNFDSRLAALLTKKRKKQLVQFLGIVVIIFVLFKFFSFLANRKPKEKIKISSVKQALPVRNIEQVTVPKIEASKIVKEVPKIIKKEEPKVNVTVPIVETPKKVQVVEPAVEPVPTIVEAVSKPISLTVKANEKSWLRVKSDGIVVFQSSLQAGGIETWDAQKDIEISGRNLNKLEFELNGKMIGNLGRADRKAKKIIITKDGLSVVM